ncbi:helix-turn-helix transcriptional regulator [Hwanghaeella sp. 1Z406]|jgi:predicted DNA-binding transcriptional regulator AlpA|uniref:helix-turn-helix transcriptional regulator n=1 Tax=Hwanghaeella sp. 1Z406 TaxID=3402811 RepID=UPI003B680617
MNENQWIRTIKAAEYVGLSRSTLEKLRVYGGGPAYSALGRAIVYRVQDLDSWVSANRRTSTSQTTKEVT